MAEAKHRNTKRFSRNFLSKLEWGVKRNPLNESHSNSLPGTKLRAEPGMYDIFKGFESEESLTNSYTEEDLIMETVVKIQNFECGDAPLQRSELKKTTSKKCLKI